MPGNIRIATANRVSFCQELRLAKGGVRFAKCDHALHESQKITESTGKRPIEPIPFLILTIGIVIAALATTTFISHVDHRNALTYKEQCNGVFLLPQPQRVDGRIIRFALHAGVPTVVVVGTVIVVLAVVEVVLFVIRDEITESESVVAGHEVYRSGRLPSGCQVEVGRAHDPLDHLTDHANVALEETASGIAEFAIPLQPAAI